MKKLYYNHFIYSSILTVLFLGCSSFNALFLGKPEIRIETIRDDFEDLVIYRMHGNHLGDSSYPRHYADLNVQKLESPKYGILYSLIVYFYSSQRLNLISSFESLVLLIDGERIGFSHSGFPQYDVHISPSTRYVYNSVTAYYPIELEDLKRIISAKSIRVKLAGSPTSFEFFLTQDNIKALSDFFETYCRPEKEGEIHQKSL